MNKNNYLFSELINIQGVVKTFKYLLNLKQLKPDIRVKHIRDLDLNKLKQDNNIKYIVFDKDNTIALHKSNEIPNEEMKQILTNFSNIFGADNIAILSNTAGSANDKNFSDLNLIQKNFEIKVIKHKYKKPAVDLEIFEHFRLNEKPSLSERKSICCIGDRLFTDVIMGKEIDSFTILVDPLDSSTDNFIVKNIRKIENYIVDKIMI